MPITVRHDPDLHLAGMLAYRAGQEAAEAERSEREEALAMRAQTALATEAVRGLAAKEAIEAQQHARRIADAERFQYDLARIEAANRARMEAQEAAARTKTEEAIRFYTERQKRELEDIQNKISMVETDPRFDDYTRQTIKNALLLRAVGIKNSGGIKIPDPPMEEIVKRDTFILPNGTLAYRGDLKVLPPPEAKVAARDRAMVNSLLGDLIKVRGDLRGAEALEKAAEETGNGELRSRALAEKARAAAMEREIIARLRALGELTEEPEEAPPAVAAEEESETEKVMRWIMAPLAEEE